MLLDERCHGANNKIDPMMLSYLWIVCAMLCYGSFLSDLVHRSYLSLSLGGYLANKFVPNMNHKSSHCQAENFAIALDSCSDSGGKKKI